MMYWLIVMTLTPQGPVRMDIAQLDKQDCYRVMRWYKEAHNEDKMMCVSDDRYAKMPKGVEVFK